jgi:hypothetical protein
MRLMRRWLYALYALYERCTYRYRCRELTATQHRSVRAGSSTILMESQSPTIATLVPTLECAHRMLALARS